MSELKPCPFCGGKEGRDIEIRSEGVERIVYECDNCGATGPHGYSAKNAFDQWNTRPIEDLLTAENERLKKALSAIRTELAMCERSMKRDEAFFIVQKALLGGE